MSIYKNRSSRYVRAMILSTGLSLLGAAQAQSAPPAIPTSFAGLNLPNNYFERFSDVGVLAERGTGFGVRYFPLPIEPDIRVTLAKRPNYWEYGVRTRFNNTTFLAAVVDGGADAQGASARYGIPTLLVTHNPRTGPQFGAFLQKNPNLSDKAIYGNFSAGYALVAVDGKVHILNNVGLAFTERNTFPYTQTEVSAGAPLKTGNLYTYFAMTGRLFTFPTAAMYHGSIDFTVVGNWAATKNFNVEATHLERFATGQSPVGDLTPYGRWQETHAAATYRFPVAVSEPVVTLGALRTRATRYWRNDDTYMRNDVLLRFEGVPIMVGPSIGYRWAPQKAGVRASDQSSLLLGISFLPR